MDTLKKLTAEVIGQWRLSPEDSEKIAEQIVEGIRKKYRIEPKGTPIKPEDVKRGDRLRIEYENGDVNVTTALGPFSWTINPKIYLLDRPDPDANFVFPRGKGAIVRMEARDGQKFPSPALALLGSEDDIYRSVTGRASNHTEQEIRSEYHNFEIVSDGSDQ